jgi:hypothetical protein
VPVYKEILSLGDDDVGNGDKKGRNCDALYLGDGTENDLHKMIQMASFKVRVREYTD